MKPNVTGVLILFLFLSFFKEVSAQRRKGASKEQLSQKEASAIIQQKAELFPKFTAQLALIKKNEAVVKEVRFVRGTGRGNPASAGKGWITIDISFIETPNRAYDDNRLVVVLFHELGHLHYKAQQRPGAEKSDNEKFAFEYSLKRVMELAKAGDCLPLQTAIKFLTQRSKSNNTSDIHVVALKRLVQEPLFIEYRKYAESCGGN